MPRRELARTDNDRQYPTASPAPRAQFYADDSVDPALVYVLQQNEIDVTSSKGLGHDGWEEDERLRYAKAAGRIFVTHAGINLWLDDSVAWDEVHGLIVLDVDANDRINAAGAVCLLHAEIFWHNGAWAGVKALLSATALRVKVRDEHGAVTLTTRRVRPPARR